MPAALLKTKNCEETQKYQYLWGKEIVALRLEANVGTEWSSCAWLAGLLVCSFIHSFVHLFIQQMLFEHRLFAAHNARLSCVYPVVMGTWSSTELLLGQQALAALFPLVRLCLQPGEQPYKFTLSDWVHALNAQRFWDWRAEQWRVWTLSHSVLG